ncbi:MAG: STAS domain-containing protein [Candidatus Muiribacteriota bacterium]
MKGKILVAQKNNILFLKITGNIVYNDFRGFDIYLSDLFEKKDIKNAVIDLNEAKSIDSTNLGLIAKVAVNIFKKYEKKIILISENDDITRVIESMGFSQIMHIVKSFKCDDKLNYNNIVSDMNVDKNEAEEVNTMLEAHKQLAELTPENRDKFEKVIEFLENELK